MDDARHEDVVPPSREVMNRLRHKIQFCIPLTQDEVDSLWVYATGEPILRRKRCDRCNAEGRLYIQSVPVPILCNACIGTGYITTSKRVLLPF